VRAAALDDGLFDSRIRCQPAAPIEDHAGAGVGLEALLEIVKEGGLGRGDDDQVAEVDRFDEQFAPPRCCSPAECNAHIWVSPRKIVSDGELLANRAVSGGGEDAPEGRRVRPGEGSVLAQGARFRADVSRGGEKLCGRPWIDVGPRPGTPLEDHGPRRVGAAAGHRPMTLHPAVAVEHLFPVAADGVTGDDLARAHRTHDFGAVDVGDAAVGAERDVLTGLNADAADRAAREVHHSQTSVSKESEPRYQTDVTTDACTCNLPPLPARRQGKACRVIFLVARAVSSVGRAPDF